MKIKQFSTGTFCASLLFIASVFTTSCSKDDNAVTDSKSLLKAVTTEAALKSAVASAKGGTTITISGTIYLTSTLQLLNSGTSSSKINLTGGTLNCSNMTSGWGIKLLGSYWNVTNMTVSYSPTNGVVLATGGYNYLYNVTSIYNKWGGIIIYSGSHNNLLSYCNAKENYDTQNAGQNADGFAISLSCGAGNKADHCVSYYNSDDGYDLYGAGYAVVLTNCSATYNGRGTAGNGNGFKLGSSGQSLTHTVTNCTSSNNRAWGYDGNGNTGHITTTGSGGSSNGSGLWTRIY